MTEMTTEKKPERTAEEASVLEIALPERIENDEAEQLEKQVLEDPAAAACQKIVLNAEKTKYINSCGMRALLKIVKVKKNVSMVHCGSELYSLLEMTGFAKLIPIERSSSLL